MCTTRRTHTTTAASLVNTSSNSTPAALSLLLHAAPSTLYRRCSLLQPLQLQLPAGGLSLSLPLSPQ